MGDTIFSYFIYNKLQAKKIYAFEGEKSIFEKLNRNLELLPETMRKNVKTINAFIGENTGFETIIDERVSLVNADIEGEELGVLKALRGIIVRDRPVLSICIYHKPEDLVDIPHFINSIVEDYCYVIRKYHASAASVNYAAELVLYAIPCERKVQ